MTELHLNWTPKPTNIVCIITESDIHLSLECTDFLPDIMRGPYWE